MAGEFASRSFVNAQGSLSLRPLTDRLVLLSGAGGNITLLRSDDGLLMLIPGFPRPEPQSPAR